MPSIPASGLRSVGYYPSWSSLGPQPFMPTDLPVENLTHLVYGFAKIEENGQCDHYDKYADVEKLFTGDKPEASGNNIFGNVKQLVALKSRHRHLKTIISIGGWRLSGTISAAISSPERRTRFVETCMHCMYNFGWDGIDIAWLGPQTETDGENYVELLREFRQAIDKYRAEAGANPITLSAVAPTKAEMYSHMKLAEMDQYLDFWNLMAYSYNGASPKPDATLPATYAAPLTKSSDHPNASPFTVVDTVDHFLAAGIDPAKFNIGISLYAQAYYNTNGPGHAAGAFENDWNQTLVPVKDTPRAGATQYWDDSAQAAYSYDASKRTMLTYETRRSLQAKIDVLVHDKKIGGLAFWGLEGDAPGERSLVRQAALALGGPNGSGLDLSANTIHYPLSDKDNIRLLGRGADKAVDQQAHSGPEQIAVDISSEVLKDMFPFLPQSKQARAVFYLQ